MVLVALLWRVQMWYPALLALLTVHQELMTDPFNTRLVLDSYLEDIKKQMDFCMKLSSVCCLFGAIQGNQQPLPERMRDME